MTEAARQYFTIDEVLDRYERRITKRTLSRWRESGCGPNWIRLGWRVLYPRLDLTQWEQTRGRKWIERLKRGRGHAGRR